MSDIDFNKIKEMNAEIDALIAENKERYPYAERMQESIRTNLASCKTKEERCSMAYSMMIEKFKEMTEKLQELQRSTTR